MYLNDLFTTSSGPNCASWLPELRFGQSKALWNWLCAIRTCISNFKTPCEISLRLWRLPCHSMMSPKPPYNLSSSLNCISRFPELRFGQSKAFRILLCYLLTHMSSISACQDFTVSLWHPLWRVIASQKIPYDLFTTFSSQNCISWLPELCFRQSKTCRTWLCNLQTHMTSIRTDCDGSVPLWHYQNQRAASLRSPPVKIALQPPPVKIVQLSFQRSILVDPKHVRTGFAITGHIKQVSVHIVTF